MANILICFHAEAQFTGFKEEALIVFYESLVESLRTRGNNILIFNSDFFPGEKIESNALKRGVDQSKLAASIKFFSPDLIISFNHTLPPNIKSHVSCPVLLWAGDGLWYWKDGREALGQDYPVIVNSEGMLWEFSRLGFTNVHRLSLATSICAEHKEKIHNISFIGSLFRHKRCTEMLSIFPEHRKKVQNIIQAFCRKNEYNITALFDENNAADILPICSHDEIFYGMIDLRLTVIAALLEDGIEIYGTQSWGDLSSPHWPFLAASYNPQKVYSLKHNQDIYNSSKIALNINHPQAKLDGFSWRVYDILASDACILSQKNTGLQKLLKPYIDLPMFESPSEAHTLAKKLLESPSWRREITEASNTFIEKEGRWDKNIQLLEEITGVSLHYANEGKTVFLKSADYFTGFGKAVNKVVSLFPDPTTSENKVHRMLTKKVLKFGKRLTGLNIENESRLRNYRP